MNFCIKSGKRWMCNEPSAVRQKECDYWREPQFVNSPFCGNQGPHGCCKSHKARVYTAAGK